jgi:hypothetical protein
VLRVGIGCVDGDGSLAEQVYVRHLRLESRLHRRCRDGVDAVLQLGADAAAQQECGQIAAIYDGFDEGVWVCLLVVVRFGLGVVWCEYRSSLWLYLGWRLQENWGVQIDSISRRANGEVELVTEDTCLLYSRFRGSKDRIIVCSHINSPTCRGRHAKCCK